MWLKHPTPEKLNGMSEGTLMQALGIKFIGLRDNALVATMPVDGRTRQPFGLLHGGASVALAETLGSTASHLCIDEEKQFSVGLEINANHISDFNLPVLKVRPCGFGPSPQGLQE